MFGRTTIITSLNIQAFFMLRLWDSSDLLYIGRGDGCAICGIGFWDSLSVHFDC